MDHDEGMDCDEGIDRVEEGMDYSYDEGMDCDTRHGRNLGRCILHMTVQVRASVCCLSLEQRDSDATLSKPDVGPSRKSSRGRVHAHALALAARDALAQGRADDDVADMHAARSSRA